MSCFGSKSKKQNNQIILVAFIFIIVLMVATSTSLMQSVGDRQLVLTCDTLSEGDSGWQVLTGDIEIDTTRQVEGTGSIKGTVWSGTWGAYFYVSWYDVFPDEHKFDLRGWNEISFSIYPEGLATAPGLTFVLKSYEWDAEHSVWSWTVWDYTLTIQLDTWNNFIIDLYEPDGPSTSSSGATFTAPGLEHCSGLMWVYRIGYDTTTVHTLNIDNVEKIYTGIAEPPASVNLYVTPSTGSSTVGTPASFTATASGGTPPYTYTWYVDDEVQSDTDENFAYTATSVATYTIRCDVADSSTPALTASDSSILYVTTPGGPGVTTHTLTVASTEGGKVTDTSDSVFEGTFELNQDTQIQVQAVPNQNYVFANWDLDGTNATDNPLTIVMNEDHTVTAYFTYSPGGNGDTITSGGPTGITLDELAKMPIEYIAIGVAIPTTAVVLLIARKKRWV